MCVAATLIISVTIIVLLIWTPYDCAASRQGYCCFTFSRSVTGVGAVVVVAAVAVGLAATVDARGIVATNFNSFSCCT